MPELPRVHAKGATDLERFMAEVRKATAASSVGSKLNTANRVESSDGDLRRALNELQNHDTPAARHRAASVYLRLGIRDAAFDQYEAALKLDPRDAAAYDAVARLWRDWGWLDFALSSAHRAVYYAPGSPEAHNTLGTILAALGLPDRARTEFERARQLDPNATWAAMNLCRLGAQGITGAGTVDCDAATVQGRFSRGAPTAPATAIRVEPPIARAKSPGTGDDSSTWWSGARTDASHDPTPR